MLKVIYFTSENENRFGIYKVVSQLLKNLKNKVNAKYSKDIIDLFLFKPDIVHIHGCWRPILLIVFLIAKIKGIKITISPHGMLDPYSMNQKKIKKLIAWHLYQKYIFVHSDLIIVNSNLEKKNFFKKIKVLKLVNVIPHGTNFDNNFRLRKKRNKIFKFVFFSRIHPSKNLIKLIKIWTSNSFYKKYSLDIYGEITDKKYFHKVKEEYLNHKNIQYKGVIKNNKQNKLSMYDIFLHPSNSENFGLVILEALSSGLYSFINQKLYWKNLEKKGYGKMIKFENDQIKKSIINAEKIKIKLNRLSFKRKMIEYVKKNYNWNKITQIYINSYNSIT